MKRRAFLVGSAGILSVLGGCLGDSPSGSGNDTSTARTSTDRPTPSPSPTDRPKTTETRSTTSTTDERSTTRTTRPPRTAETPAETDDGTATRDRKEPTTSETTFFGIGSKYSQPQEIVRLDYRGVIATREAEYEDSARRNGTSETPLPIGTTASTARTGDSGSFESDDPALLWNDSEETREITVQVTLTDRPDDPLGGETYTEDAPANPILERTFSIDPDAFVTIRFARAGTYELAVGVGEQPSTTIDYETDNCNSQSLYITAAADGSIDSSGASTLVACDVVRITTDGDRSGTENTSARSD